MTAQDLSEEELRQAFADVAAHVTTQSINGGGVAVRARHKRTRQAVLAAAAMATVVIATAAVINGGAFSSSSFVTPGAGGHGSMPSRAGGKAGTGTQTLTPIPVRHVRTLRVAGATKDIAWSPDAQRWCAGSMRGDEVSPSHCVAISAAKTPGFLDTLVDLGPTNHPLFVSVVSPEVTSATATFEGRDFIAHVEPAVGLSASYAWVEIPDSAATDARTATWTLRTADGRIAQSCDVSTCGPTDGHRTSG